MDYYEVWSSYLPTSEFGLIGMITKDSIVAAITFADNSYEKKGLLYYKVYAYRHGIASLAATSSITSVQNVLDVTGVELVSTAHTITIMWDNPIDRRLAYTDVKIHFHAVELSLTEGLSTIIYSGNRTSVTYAIPDTNRNDLYKVWVNPITRS